MANRSDGVYEPFSMAMIVCRVTPIATASCSWVTFAFKRNFWTEFSIVSIVEPDYTVEGYNADMNPLTTIPGIGKSIAQDLNDIGIYRVEELNGKDPKLLYKKICKRQGVKLDRCLLYVMRCAVYFASNTSHDPDLLKWWKWID